MKRRERKRDQKTNLDLWVPGNQKETELKLFEM